MRKILALPLLLVLVGAPHAETTFNVDPYSDCGTADPFWDGPTYTLPAGLQLIRWESGGHSYWSSDNHSGGTAWRALIKGYVHATGEILHWSSGEEYASLAEATADAAGSIIEWEIPVASEVTFYIYDVPCGDNRGLITLTLLDSPTAATRELPLAFALQAPVPNPFNPATTLAFTLPETGHVELGVYDLQGRLVSQLVDGLLSRGEHEAVFEAGALPSGMYLARLETGLGESTRKLMLVK